MSLRYALPQVFAAAEEGRSVMRALSSNPSGAAPVFNAPRGGMTSLIDAVAGSAPLEIRSGTEVRAVRRSGERGWEIQLATGESLEADAVVVALPAHQAAPILAEGSGLGSAAIAALRAMPHASVASIALAYKEGDLAPPPGSSGFLVPSRNQQTLAAGTWWSRKWPHTRAEGMDTVRCFVGRTARHPALDLDDDELVRRAAGEITRLTGATRPIASRVDRWDDGLPQFEVGHHERLEAIRAGTEALPGLEITGPDLTGSGIPECVKQAERAARACLATALVSEA
jgi:oxygen-dependent protoporphyrinogen oxidase